jgi:hypothetical protein
MHQLQEESAGPLHVSPIVIPESLDELLLFDAVRTTIIANTATANIADSQLAATDLSETVQIGRQALGEAVCQLPSSHEVREVWHSQPQTPHPRQ